MNKKDYIMVTRPAGGRQNSDVGFSFFCGKTKQVLLFATLDYFSLPKLLYSFFLLMPRSFAALLLFPPA
jgi:hypothetical protein